jgi:hypothetical protein
MTLERKDDGLWMHVINGEQQCSFHLGYGLREDGKETLAVQLLRAYLAAQAEWPSEADVEIACRAYGIAANGLGFAYKAAMRAALQSVRPPATHAEFMAMGEAAHREFDKIDAALRPPVGVVSEPEWIGSLRNELMQSKSTHNFTFTRDEVMALLASRHAPTKE